MNLNQATLNVTDFQRSVDFYTTLGLKLIVSARGEYARFECEGGATLSLHLGEAPEGNGPMLYFECDDLDPRVERLKAEGIAFDSEPEDQPWLWREARLSDPDGNRLCFYHAGQNRRFPPWRIPD